MTQPAAIKTDAPHISVALCTYNGAPFISEQLLSILQQTHPVDEIIVADDGSHDETLDRVRSILSASPIPWNLLTGEHLGVTRNFARALAACVGDLIFLCDQDDVWLPEKVARILAVFQDDPLAEVVFSNARLVDARRRDLGKAQFDMVRLTPKRLATLAGPRAFEVLLRRNVVTDATVACKRQALEYALPFVDGWLHDEWLAILAAARGRLRGIDEPLVLYRQHERNQCGMRPEHLWRQVAEAAAKPKETAGVKRLCHLRERLVAHPSLAVPAYLAHIDRALRFQQERNRFSTKKILRAFQITRMFLTGSYHRFADGWRSAVKDVLYSHDCR